MFTLDLELLWLHPPYPDSTPCTFFAILGHPKEASTPSQFRVVDVTSLLSQRKAQRIRGLPKIRDANWPHNSKATIQPAVCFLREGDQQLLVLFGVSRYEIDLLLWRSQGLTPM